MGLSGDFFQVAADFVPRVRRLLQSSLRGCRLSPFFAARTDGRLGKDPQPNPTPLYLGQEAAIDLFLDCRWCGSFRVSRPMCRPSPVAGPIPDQSSSALLTFPPLAFATNARVRDPSVPYVAEAFPRPPSFF